MKMNSLNVGYRLVRNATPTADKAPYTGIAIPVGSLAYDNILAKMIDAGTFMTKATAQFFLNAFFEYAAKEIAEKVVRVNMGPVAIYPMIDGSFDSEDDGFREPRNSLYVGATLSREIRDAVAGVKPDYFGDEAAASTVKINSVFDLESMVPGVIAGTRDFRLCGIDLTVPDGEGESLSLVKADGVTKVADVVVSETEDGQRITCHLVAAAAVPMGQYRVRLVSRGLDPTAPLATVTKKVELVEAIPAPEPTPVTKVCYRDAETHEMFDGLPSKGEFTLVTSGHRALCAEHGDKVKLEWTDGDGQGHEAEADVDCYNESDGGVDCFSLESKGLSIVDGTTVRLTVTDEEGTTSVEATWLDLG